MKKILPDIAKKNGFVAKMINPSEHAWYAKSLEKDRWWLWLCSLEMWFREEHLIEVFPVWSYNDNPHWTVMVCYLDKRSEEDPLIRISGIDFEPTLYKTKEDALAQGLLEAFKMI